MLARVGHNCYGRFSGEKAVVEATSKQLYQRGVKQLAAMGVKSEAIIDEYSPQRFSDGALAAIDYCATRNRRQRSSVVGRLILRMWKSQY